MILLFTFLTIAFSHAYTPEEVTQLVLDRFPLIEEADRKARAQEAMELSAKGSFDHKLKAKTLKRIEDKYDNDFFQVELQRQTGLGGLALVAGLRQGTGVFPAYDGKLETSSAGEIFAGLTLPLLQGFKTDEARSNLGIAKLESEQAKEELRLKKNMYVHKALSLYYKWLLTRKIVGVQESILKLAETREEMVGRRHRQGDVEGIKKTDAERSVLKRRSEVLKTKAKQRLLEAELRLYLPELPENDILPETPWPQKSKGALLLSELPQLKILNLERQKIEIRRRLAENQKLPELSVSLLGSKELSRDVPYDPEVLQVAVGFSFPLENRKARGKSVAEEYKKGALEKRLEFGSQDYSFSYEALKDSYKILLQSWTNLKSEAKSTDTMARGERAKWRQGGSDLYFVNLREEDVADVEIKKWSTIVELAQTDLDLRLLEVNLVP
jgi:outer membrane protein, heavy metal efflux system